MAREYNIRIPRPHAKQLEFLNSEAKRQIVKAGRRGGKTVGVGIKAINRFVEKARRVLYAVPTSDQVARFWSTVVIALQEPINDGWYYKNETEHVICLSENAIKELSKNPVNDKEYIRRLRESRIRAKTA